MWFQDNFTFYLKCRRRSSNKNGIRHACSTADITDCHKLPQTTPNMPQIIHWQWLWTNHTRLCYICDIHDAVIFGYHPTDEQGNSRSSMCDRTFHPHCTGLWIRVVSNLLCDFNWLFFPGNFIGKLFASKCWMKKWAFKILLKCWKKDEAFKVLLKAHTRIQIASNLLWNFNKPFFHGNCVKSFVSFFHWNCVGNFFIQMLNEEISF